MRRVLPVLTLGAALVLAGCGASPQTSPGTSAPTPSPDAVHVQPSGDPVEVTTGLTLPWSIARIDAQETLVSQRDDARILSVASDRSPVEVGVVPGVSHGGEGGLLGIAHLAGDGDDAWLYAFITTGDDNRIVRMPYDGDSLGEAEVVLEGIAKAGNHNGGRIAFGPDGMLYATTGDAARPDLSQDPDSLNGKILRMTATGAVPDDNPTAGSLVYSLGHRNPQGIAWDADGQLWAAEFGQNTWDEFNRIEPGANYGWPVVEGITGESGFVDPVLQWATSEASPSGLAFVDGTFFLAALRGERVWAIDIADDGTAGATPWFAGEFGRIRDVTAGPDGSLWFLTNDVDGGDRLMQVALVPVTEG
ncbi:PQQ-dependent sugar dehydrogenase [Pseudolysinimonas sp.]|jgi:glucose/arabinose dehydrogenase|uniref:PQQ-dependent sugar dehydrogenase n=1 Tax=Pseudolysinimonas sp. TaxID=2680009 RepID=UPI0037839BBA